MRRRTIGGKMTMLKRTIEGRSSAIGGVTNEIHALSKVDRADGGAGVSFIFQKLLLNSNGFVASPELLRS